MLLCGENEHNLAVQDKAYSLYQATCLNLVVDVRYRCRIAGAKLQRGVIVGAGRDLSMRSGQQIDIPVWKLRFLAFTAVQFPLAVKACALIFNSRYLQG